MIRFLRGTILEKVRSQLIIEVHGVGYDVFVTPGTLTGAQTGEQIAVYVAESIREDAHDLYGFLSSSERDVFSLLRRVSGVGPKVAMAITGFFSPAQLADIIRTGDASQLSLVPGIGKKLASKIMVELRDKQVTEVPTPEHTDDTIAALESLGYNHQEIARVLPKIPSALETTSEKVTWILRNLGE